MAQSSTTADSYFQKGRECIRNHNYEEGMYWYKRAAELGNVVAMRNLGSCYKIGAGGMEPNFTEAIRWYRMAADRGEMAAYSYLGELYENGQGVPQDYEEAIRCYQKSIECGNRFAQKDVERCQNELRISKMSAEECYNNGMSFYKKEKYSQAAQWFTIAANKGLAKAQYELGNCYQIGKGVEEDPDIAIKLWKLAAKNGYAKAQAELGFQYLYGTYIDSNMKEAFHWYLKAANQGYYLAQYHIGEFYEYGREPVQKDMTEAVKWYLKAANQGYITSQFRLGECYEKGEGVTKNKVEAAKWYRKVISNPEEDIFEKDKAKNALNRMGY